MRTFFQGFAYAIFVSLVLCDLVDDKNSKTSRAVYLWISTGHAKTADVGHVTVTSRTASRDFETRVDWKKNPKPLLKRA